MMTSWFMKSLLEVSSGREISIDKNTTLNEKYEILTDMTPPEGVFPPVNYYGIGIGGIGEPIKTAYHGAMDGALFEQIPFVVRQLSFDLSPMEALRYRFRVVQIIDGMQYVFYYLKVFDQVSEQITIKKLVKEESGGASVSLYNTNDPEILNPIPRKLAEFDLTKSTFYVVDSRINFSLTREEKDDIILAYQTLTQSTDIPAVTELGLFTGLDTETSLGSLEAYVVRAAYFYAIPYELQSMLFTDDVTQRYIDLGGMRMR